VIAVFILILAIVNLSNLAPARASERMKETGINKILGASQRRVTIQFFAEFFMMTLVAGAFSLVLLILFIFPFNNVMNSSLSIAELADFDIQLAFTLILAATSITAGLYPAYSMSTFRPSQVIRRSSTSNKNQQRVREGLVVLQFVISFCLLTGTLIVQKQINFMQNADLGFDKNHIYILRLRSQSRNRFPQLREVLKQHAQVVKIAGASALLGGEPGSDTFHPDHMPDQTPETFAKNIAVDPEFLSLIGVPILAGRNFDADNPQDYRTAYIINETAVKQFQLNDPVNVNFRRSGEQSGKVIGVMKDFHFAKMSDRINPMVFYLDSVSSYRYMFIKLEGNVAAGVKSVERTWNNLMHEVPLEGFFQDQYFNALYEQEQQIAKITTWFSFLAIGLASLGLLGMSSFVILQRTRKLESVKLSVPP
jgi:putative ABC transport system permease protein